MFGTFMLVFLIILTVLAVIGWWMKKRAKNPVAERSPDKVLENAADLADNFNRARYQGEDGR